MFKPFATCTARILIASLVASSTFPAVALTPSVKYFATGSVPQPIEIARLLAGADFKPSLKMRGVRVTGEAPGVALPSTTLALVAVASTDTPVLRSPVTPTAASDSNSASPQSFAVSIPFGFDSAVLQPNAFEVLDNIAEGIKMVQLQGALMIEGHTDAKGNQAYNLRLSARRAQAVKRYLAKHHGIAAAKLRAVGKGQLEPLNQAQPFAPENRRVQFRMAA